jgi:hypothetical protein
MPTPAPARHACASPAAEGLGNAAIFPENVAGREGFAQQRFSGLLARLQR